MTELAYIIAIALWCGAPINSTKGATGFKSGEVIEVKDVEACRKDLLACTSKTSGKECFQKQEHPK